MQTKETVQNVVTKHEAKSEIKLSEKDLKEINLTKEKVIHNSILPVYNVESGEFENFPEIPVKTVEKLKARGITTLFPIQ